MAIQGMNHFNVLTDKLAATRSFYLGVLGFTEGPRPPLGFDGAWLYAGGQPILHVSEGRPRSLGEAENPDVKRARRGELVGEHVEVIHSLDRHKTS